MLSHGITAALNTFHAQLIHLYGQINPRTVLVKKRGPNIVPQVILPEHGNVFNNQGLGRTAQPRNTGVFGKDP